MHPTEIAEQIQELMPMCCPDGRGGSRLRDGEARALASGLA